ncbi:MAG: hypothetical protein II016_01540 [Erysipelotrichaceae bacterium]|nr:hypothetical protein [Erysipelotrichaceae bacterium]
MKIALLDASTSACAAYGAGIEDGLRELRPQLTTALGIDRGCLNLYEYFFDEEGKRRLSALREYREPGFLELMLNRFKETELPELPEPREIPAMLGFGIYDLTADTFKVIPDTMIRKDPELAMKAALAGIGNKPVLIGTSKCFSAGFKEPLPVSPIVSKHDITIVIAGKPSLLEAKREREAARELAHAFPVLSFRLRARANNYLRSYRLAERLEKEGKVVLCSPEAGNAEELYEQGISKGREIFERLKNNA